MSAATKAEPLDINAMSLADAAVAWFERGFSVIPVHPRSKRPIEDDWPNKAAKTREEVERLWRLTPNANIGLVMGGESRLVAIDIDGEEGELSLARLQLEHEQLPDTLTQRSGRKDGGRHLVFRVPEDFELGRIRNSVKFAPGLDRKAARGQIIAAPSIHESGARYQLENDVSPAPLPEWLYELIAPEKRKREQTAKRVTHLADRAMRQATAYARGALERAVRNIEGAPEGQRNDTLNREAFSLARLANSGAIDEATVREAFAEAARTAGLDEDEIEQTLTSAFRGAESAPPREVPEPRESIIRPVSPPHPVAANDATEAEPPFTFFDADDILSKPIEAPRWVVPDLHIGPGRPTMVGGYAFSCKSLFTLQLALSVATGRPLFGVWSVQKSPVLILDYESGDTLLRLRRIAHGMGIGRGELTAGDIRLTDQIRVNGFLDSREHIEAQLTELCQHYKLVIIDSLRQGTPDTDENDSRSGLILGMLTRVSRATGASFVAVHHIGKQKDSHSDQRERPRGSSALFAQFGCAMVIDPSDPDHVVKQIKTPSAASGGKFEPFRMRVEDVHDAPVSLRNADGTTLERPGLRIDLVVSGGTPERGAEKDADILAELRKRPEGASKNDLSKAAGGRRELVHQRIDALVNSGVIELRDGRYCLPATSEDEY